MSTYADLGEPLSIQARGAYEYGYTPLDDWCCGDPADATVSAWVAGSVTPSLVTLSKTYSGPEENDPEAVSGPNFRTFYPMQFIVTVDIAPGQSLTSVVLDDLLPGNLQYYDLVSSSPGGASCSEPVNPPPPPGSPGGTLSCSWAAPVFTQRGLTFDFYIPRDNAGGGRVINASTGDDITSCNNARSAPAGSRSIPAICSMVVPSLSTPAACEFTLTDKSLAIQKGVSNLTGGGQFARRCARIRRCASRSRIFCLQQPHHHRHGF